jgi:hypothetical protein
VGSSLEGKSKAKLTRVSTLVKEAMTEALTRILTPRRSTVIIIINMLTLVHQIVLHI